MDDRIINMGLSHNKTDSSGFSVGSENRDSGGFWRTGADRSDGRRPCRTGTDKE